MGQTRLKQAALLAVAMQVGACASAYLPVDASGARTAAAPPSTQPPRAPEPAAAASLGGSAPPKSDGCGAAALAYMIGRPRAELPVPVDLSRRRVICSTCAVTGPLQPDRQTVLYDSASQRIVAVSCG